MRLPRFQSALRVLLLSTLALAPLASARLVQAEVAVVPASGGAGALVLTSGARTYQMQIAESHLSAIPVGSIITGISLRARGVSGSTPAANTSFAAFEITLAEAANPIGSFSATVANNMENPIKVRQGAYTIAAGEYVFSANPSPWSALIDFDTDYTYEGGDLVMKISHGSASGSLSISTDAATSSWADAEDKGYVAGWANGHNTSTLANNISVIVTQFHYTPVPEPAEYAAIAGLGLLAFAGWRRRRTLAAKSASPTHGCGGAAALNPGQ